jgi:2-methylcitrate dehydratase PrpD
MFHEKKEDFKMSTAIEELVSNVLETKFESFSDEAVEDVKKRFIDVLGCAIGGANASGNSMLLDLVREWGGKEEATILVHGNRVPLHHAAMMNCIMCRSFDYEVIGPEPEGEATGRFTSHICATTDPTALSVGEYKGSSGREIISAAILGGDMAARIASAEDFDDLHSFELTGTVTAFGATAVAGRLWGLNESQLLNALGIVVDQLGGLWQHIADGVNSFKLNTGLSAKDAIFSVELANKGFTGIRDPLLSPHGYFAQYCKSYQSKFLTLDLGKRFYTKGAHKFRPSCYITHAPIECCLEILSKHNINAEDIVEVTVEVPSNRLLSDQNYLLAPYELDALQGRALFNIPYAVANVLMRKSTKLEHYTDDFTHDPKIVELTRKVKMVGRTAQGSVKEDVVAGVDLEIKMKDGKQFSASIDAPRGTLWHPLTKEEIRDKFWANVDFSKTVSRKNAEEALAMIESLEELENIDKIVKLLVQVAS